MNDHLSVPPVGAVFVPTPGTNVDAARGRSIATRDPAIIQGWAARHSAEPATGESSASGPATIAVNDGSVGIRFNFPASGRFRPISWDEWLAHLEEHRLVFVYEEETADRAHALWLERGGADGSASHDWREAERQLRQTAKEASGRYWFVQRRAETSA